MSNDLTQTALKRSDAYRLLAACFYEPEREMFIEENLCVNLAGLMAQICPTAAEYCRAMGDGLEANSQEELLQEYSALFLGPFSIPAQPFGSVYLEKEKVLMGDSTMEVKKIYAQNGVQHDVPGPPDHIAIELEFMSLLEGRMAQALTEAKQEELAELSSTRAHFFNKFLASWIPQFGKAMVDNTEMPFYRALGQGLIAFIAGEKEKIGQPAEGAAAP